FRDFLFYSIFAQMLYQFRKIAEKHQLWNDDDTLLIAVSGGLDSMVLLDLCRQLYNPIAVAHCNFQLRGDDADADEKLVQEICLQHKIQFHLKRFDTKNYAEQNGISIEMAARDLRYAYFEELCKQHGYAKIVTAHHANDNAETLLLNLTKGTGIKGLTGIPRKRENIVRPLLAFTRDELQEYAEANLLKYHNDETNSNVIFQRNKIRHKVLPLLEEINPSAVQTLNADAERLQEVREIYDNFVQERLEKIVAKNTILITDLAKEKYAKSLLFEWLQTFGFSATVVDNVLATLLETEEKQFFAGKYRLIKSRGKLEVVTKTIQNKEVFEVGKSGISTPICLKIGAFDGNFK
ncbi:MAG: tRNA lysidine(34) synthetase TilS, partial [Draconibacterium sp.]